MRLALPLLVLLFLASLAPLGSAQEAPKTTALLTDAPGDVRSEVNGVPGPPATTAYPGADLLALAVTESAAEFTFTLTMAALPDAKDAGVDGVAYMVEFAHNGRQFQIRAWDGLPATRDVASSQPFAEFSYRDSADEAWSSLWFSAPMVDPATKSLSVAVPRLDLVDAQGASPYPGRSLEGIWAQAHASLQDSSIGLGLSTVTLPQRFADDMPDDRAQAASLPVLIGLRQTGHARLTSLEPFRASNGEATTILYKVLGHNDGPAADRFEVTASSVPHGYTLTLPVPVVDIPSASSAEIPVMLTMPFGHQHGGSASALLEMRSLTDDASVGRMEIGVRYLAIPQPAGHHDTVYLHKAANIGGLGPAFGYRTGYINTLEEDPADTHEKYGASSIYIEQGGRLGAHFLYPLRPGLSMGLDVDPANVGHLRVPIGTTAPMRGTTVSASLFVSPGLDYPDGEPIMLATMPETTPEDVMPKSEVLIEGDLVPVADAGQVPYTRGQDLWLEVVVMTTGQTFSSMDEGVYIAPGGSARLPLREWHDAVDEVLAALDGPGLSPLGPQERLVNPGKGAVFPVSVANPLDHAVEVQFEVTGPHAEWATLSTTTLTAPAHGVAQASVVVRVPAGTADGERADLVLQAFAHDDPTARGLLRLVAESDTDADHPDDLATLGTSEKKSPGPATALTGLTVLGVAVALARRRKGLL
jgi:hypothetical protein